MYHCSLIWWSMCTEYPSRFKEHTKYKWMNALPSSSVLSSPCCFILLFYYLSSHLHRTILITLKSVSIRSSYSALTLLNYFYFLCLCFPFPSVVLKSADRNILLQSIYQTIQQPSLLSLVRHEKNTTDNLLSGTD